MRAVRRQGRGRNAASGQGLVEFALVLPLILLLFMGIFDLGRGIFAFNEVSNAAREGGRTGIINQNLVDVRARAAAQAVGLGVPTAVPASCPTNGGPPGASDPAGICVAILRSDGSDCSALSDKIGCEVVVSVKYTFTPILTSLPVIGTFLRPLTLSSTTTQTIEATCSGGGCTSP
jgi:Flp pilus assembly protein TadG